MREEIVFLWVNVSIVLSCLGIISLILFFAEKMKNVSLVSKVKRRDEEIERKNAVIHKLKQEAGEKNEKLDELERHVGIDPLTGIPDRRDLEKVVKMEMENFQRFGIPFTIALLDVNNFKGVNNTLGHQTGDMVLKKLAKLLQKRIRANDFVCRLGGDEFVMVFPGMTEKGVGAKVEELSNLFMTIMHGNKIPPELNVGLSIGYCSCQEQENYDGLLDRVDKLMYARKAEAKTLADRRHR